MEWKDHNRRAVNLKWERFEHRWISFHACSLPQPYQSRRKSVFKKYCFKVKDCERVIDVNKITTNPRQQRANELQTKLNVQTYRVLLGPNVSWPMTEGKKWMQNLPAFPVALEQTFQSSLHFHFQAVTKVFLLLLKTNHILAFTVVTKINYMMQLWAIFWSYLERLIQRYSSLNYRYTARDQIRGLRLIWTFC